MNKIFKRTIATLLTVAAFATVGPVKYTSLFTKEANAAETKDENAVLTDLKVKRGNSTAKLYKKKTFKKSYETELESDRKDYYVDLGTKSKITIDAETNSDYKVKLYKGSSKKDLDDEISVSKGKTTFYLKIYDKDDKEVNKYTVYAYRDNDKDDDDDDDDDYDDIYLKNLEVDGDEVKLKESKTTYTVDVKESKTSVKIVAEPDDDDYKVRIAGDTVDEDDDYEKKVTLKKGENKFEIRLRDKENDEERTYTLIINRGSSSDKEDEKDEDKNNNSNNNTNVNARPNQWVTVNGNLMYNDSLGNPIKNSWFIDRNTGAWYYFQADGTTKKGWFYDKGNWYYLNQYSGQMQTGWSYINGQWYCLNSSGAMQTGWIKSDWSGDWYYCDGSGKMLRNTTVGGYRLASSGAWVR